MILELLALFISTWCFLQTAELDSCGWPTLVPKLTVPEQERPCLFLVPLYKSHEGILISACTSRDLLLIKGDGDGEVGGGGPNRLPLKLLAQPGPCENR